MKVNIYKLKNQLEKILIEHNVEKKHAKIIAHDYWEAELIGKKTHGLTKFIKELPFLKDRDGSPQVLIDKGAMLLIDGKREYGAIAADFCTDIVIKRAKKYGIASVGIKNIQRYGVLHTWAKKIADNNLIGIIINECEPAAAPFGGTSKVLGSNPIAIAVPTVGEPLILDMATSQAAMSNIWKAKINNEKLPQNTFYDEQGSYTTDPDEASAVEIFGNYKGYGLSLMFEIISGSLVRAKMGSNIKNPYDIGYYFQAIDPSSFQDISSFKEQNESLIKEIKRSKKKKGVKEILVPGESSLEKKCQAIETEIVDISNTVYNMLFTNEEK